MKTLVAAIDVGTHTARLLIGSESEPSEQLNAIVRKRSYIRLAEGFDSAGKRAIQPGAIERTVETIQGFLEDIRAYDIHEIHAVGTGIIRTAANRDTFLSIIQRRTGITVHLIAGEKEGALTAKGVLNALGVQTAPSVIFDLGGGSTEFILAHNQSPIVTSLPLGASILTNAYLNSDPPEDGQISLLSNHVDTCLYASELLYQKKEPPLFVAGTGGTITALAMILNNVPPEDILPKRFNGMVIRTQQIQILFDQMKTMNLEYRLRMTGMDAGRAGIILAGCLVVLRILHFFKAIQLTVSLSDLLEGILIEQFEGENNGRQ